MKKSVFEWNKNRHSSRDYENVYCKLSVSHQQWVTSSVTDVAPVTVNLSDTNVMYTTPLSVLVTVTPPGEKRAIITNVYYI